MKALTQVELDQMVCSNPECTAPHDALVLHSRCHPDDPTWTEYDKAQGAVRVFCATCQRTVGVIAVAQMAATARH